MPAPDPVWNEALRELTRRAQALQTRGYADLVTLPPFASTTHVIHGEPIDYVTYRVTELNDDLLIVVQANREGRRVGSLQFGQCHAEGFRIRPDGQVRVVPERDLYADYI